MFKPSRFPFLQCETCPGLSITKREGLSASSDQVNYFCKLTVQRRIERDIDCPGYRPDERELFERRNTEHVHAPLRPQEQLTFSFGKFCSLGNDVCRYHSIRSDSETCDYEGKVKKLHSDRFGVSSEDVRKKSVSSMGECPLEASERLRK